MFYAQEFSFYADEFMFYAQEFSFYACRFAFVACRQIKEFVEILLSANLTVIDSRERKKVASKLKVNSEKLKM
jgi:hypothetical protein